MEQSAASDKGSAHNEKRELFPLPLVLLLTAALSILLIVGWFTLIGYGAFALFHWVVG